MTDRPISGMLVVMRAGKLPGSPIRLLPGGWLLCAAFPVFSVAGWIRGDEAMILVGWVCGWVLAMAYPVARVHARALVAEIHLPRHVVAGRPFRFRLRVGNPSRFLPAAELRASVTAEDSWDVMGRIPWIHAGGSSTMDWETVAETRAVIPSVRMTAESGFPFGLFQTTRTIVMPVQMVVRPRPVWPWNHQSLGDRGLRAGTIDHHGTAARDGEPRGTRAWQAGDRPSAIHWPATVRSIAQGSTWIVREADPLVSGRSGYTVVFHSCGGGKALIRPGRFEEALRHAAGILRRLSAEGLRVRWIADFHEWVPLDCHGGRALSDVMDLLAAATRARGTQAHELTEALEATDPRDGLIILSDFPRAAWQAAVAASTGRAWSPPEPRVHRARKAVRS